MSLEERFAAKCRVAGDCVEWTGAADQHGYGQISVAGQRKKATHAAIFLRTGQWPPAGKIVCHHCDNKRCVRFEHLYIGTQVENQRDTWLRGPSPVHKMRQAWLNRTHCIRGHAYEPGSYRMVNGYRQCIACRRFHTVQRTERDRQARLARIDALLGGGGEA